MYDWNAFAVQKEHRQDMLREAENERMVRLARMGNQANHRLHCRVLSWLGCHLVNWGLHLQKRYGAAPVTPATAC